MACAYCGRDRQTDKHQSCDGCGATKTVVFGQCCGIDVTNPHHYEVLLKHMYGYQTVKSEEIIRLYFDEYKLDRRMMRPLNGS